ncbi:hypothetical protein [Methylobacterium brachiatum]
MIVVTDPRADSFGAAVGILVPLRTDLAELIVAGGGEETSRHMPIADALEALALAVEARPGLEVRTVSLEWDAFRFGRDAAGFHLENGGRRVVENADLVSACRASARSIRSAYTTRLPLAG